MINALLGNKLLETGALPTTDCITIVAAAAEQNDDDDYNSSRSDDTKSTPLGVIVHSVKDLPLLEDLTLIDSPGTNSTWMDHTERTLKLLPSADLILFVTSAERPFSESERTLLQSIQAYRKSIVVVINKMDLLPYTDFDIDKVIHNAKSINPEIRILKTSCRTGEGLEDWANFVRTFAGK